MACPGRKSFLLRIPYDLFNDAKMLADRDNISITQYINRAVEAYAVEPPPTPEVKPVVRDMWWV